MKKKIISLLLALMLVLTSLSTTAVVASAAGEPVESNSFGFSLLSFIPGADGKCAVLDTSDPDDWIIYGVPAGSRLCDVISIPENVTLMDFDGTDDTTSKIVNGSCIELRTGNSRKTYQTYYITFHVYGDLNFDGVIDVLDSSLTEIVTSGAVTITEMAQTVPELYRDYFESGVDINRDGVVDQADFQATTNAAVSDTFDQYREEEEVANTAVTEIEPQLATGSAITPDSPIVFNDQTLVEGVDYEITYDSNVEEGLATVTITGLGLFSGTLVKTFPIVNVIGKTVAEINKILTNSGLGTAMTANYDSATGIASLDIDAGAVLGGNFSVNSASLTGLLTNLGSFFNETFANVTDITVSGRQLYNGETFDNTAIKNTLFELAGGMFVALSDIGEAGTIKSLSGSVTNASEVINFTANLNVLGEAADIATVENLAEKLARYFSFDVIGGNAVVGVKMPAGFMNTVIEILGDGDVDAAKEAFDKISVGQAFNILSGIEATDITSSADGFENLLKAIASMDNLVNKVLSKVTACTIGDASGDTYEGLSDRGFNVDRDNTNTFGALANAIGMLLSDDVRSLKISEFYNADGVYTVDFDLTVDLSALGLLTNGSISETIVLNLDIFDVTDSPSGIKSSSTNNAATLSGGSVFTSAYAANSADAFVLADESCPLLFKLDSDGNAPTVSGNIIMGLPVNCTDISAYIKAADGYLLNATPSYKSFYSTGSEISVTNGTETKTYYICAKGDINGDSVIDVLDTMIAELHVNNSDVELELNTAQEASLETLCDDGALTADDYTQQVNASISSEFTQPKRKALLTSDVSALNDVTFDGNAQTPAVSVTKGLDVLSKGIDYTVSYTSNIHAGTATATVTGTGDYMGVVKKTFTINKATLSESDFGFNSVIRAYAANSAPADVTYSTSLGNNVSILYNGSANKPTASGVYVISASVSGSTDYSDASFTLGTLTIAPASVSGSYGVDVDNANKTITVRVINAYGADSTLMTALNSFVNSNITLSIGSKTVSEVANTVFGSRSLDVYTGQTGSNITITPTTGLLGGLLPSDEALWSDSGASNTHSISVGYNGKNDNFSIVFKQDDATISNAKAAMLTTIGANGRGQRTAIGNDVLCYGKMINGYPSVRVAVNNTSATAYDALSGTGLKTMLVGYKDTLSIQASSNTSFSGKTVNTLYEKDNSNYRYVNYSGFGLLNCLPVINSVLEGMGVSLSIFSKIVTDKTGYCNYRCAESSKGLRYNNVFYLEFKKFSDVEDAHNTLTVNTPQDGKVASNITANLDRMAKGELVRLTATPNSGFTVSGITVTNTTSNTAVPVTLVNGYYTFNMPSGNVTVDATFAAK